MNGRTQNSPQPKPKPIQTPRQIYEYLDQYVIGQERAKRVVSIAAYNHFKRIQKKDTPSEKKVILNKSNILMVGPTGCGKTHIARSLAQVLNIPFHIADATEFTEAGYYGKDVEVMIGELLHRTDLNPDAASKGIIFIDEIDKLARRGEASRTGAGTRDIGGEGVQQALLKIIEGQKIFVPYNVTQHWNKHDFVEIDTSDILFICAGSFEKLERTDTRHRKAIGFEKKSDSVFNPLDMLKTEDLIRFGMIPELLGRLPVRVELKELTTDDLVRILIEPVDSIVNEYQQILDMDDIKLQFEKKAFQQIAQFALDQKIGARGLRAILEYILEDILFDAPDMEQKKVIVTEKLVKRRLLEQ